MISYLKTLLPALSLCFLVSCGSFSFDSAWQKANKEYSAGKTTPVTGPWEGTWLSDKNGHKGKLLCVVKPAGGTKESDRYHFRYWATWAGPLQGGFKAEFEIQKMGTQYHVQGREDLGVFGSFRHEGVIQGNHFEANYRSSSGDYGTFNLRRPQ